MRKYYLIILFVLLLMFSNLTFGVSNEAGTVNIPRVIQASVDLPSQKQEFVVPSDPLNFDTTLEWEVTIAKKSLAGEKDAAYFLIEDLSAPGKQIERKTISGSGKLTIPKGARYKVTIYAGEYSRIISLEGTAVKTKLKYTEAIINYSQGDKPYLFNLEVLGPTGLDNWNWFWGSNSSSNGNKVDHQFSGEGKTPIIVEGKGKTLTGLTSQKFYFELEVPPLMVINPKVEPLTGPAELKVTAKVNAVVNYGQKVTFVWDFGNGAELTGPEVGNIYLKPGKYPLVLTAKIAEYTIQKSWLVEVQPLSIIPNPVLTPLSGPIPLAVTGTLNPVIVGGPTQLKFSWELGKDIVDGNEFKHNFTEPGEYQIILKTTDKLHPAMVIPENVFFVKALPPILDVKPTASITKGIIPLSVNFDPHFTVQGSPVDLEYRWDFGDGETGNTEKINHLFKKPGQYNAQITVVDRLHQGNMATGTVKIEVLPPEMKVTTQSNVTNGLAPLTVHFNAQLGVTGSPCDPQYFWNFGDGEISVEQNPVHTFKQGGKYNVVLEVKDWLYPSNSIKSSMMIEVIVPKLRLTASVSPTSGKAPLTVNCQAWADMEGTKNPQLKYTWDFGDGITVQEMDQKHIFEQPGTYNVLVFVEDPVLGITERKTFKVVVK